MVTRIKIIDLYYSSIVLVVLSTLFQSYFSFINVGLILISMCCLVLLLIKQPIKKNDFFIYGLCVVSIIVALLKTDTSVFFYFRERGVYFLFFVFISLRFISNPEEYFLFIKEKGTFVDAVIKIWNGLVLISIFNPGFYKSLNEINGWGTGKYFYSYTAEGGARLCADCCMLLALVLIRLAITKDKKYLWYYLVPTYTIMAAGSRTYLIVYVCILVATAYFTVINKKRFFLIVIPVVIICFILVSKTPMMSKLLAVTSNERVSIMGKYDAFSNGRYTPIIKSVEYIREQSISNFLFGNGFGTIENKIGTWSFNDILEIFITYGVLGLIPYLYSTFKVIRKSISRNLPLHISVLIIACYLTVSIISLYFRTTTALLCFITLCCLGFCE